MTVAGNRQLRLTSVPYRPFSFARRAPADTILRVTVRSLHCHPIARESAGWFGAVLRRAARDGGHHPSCEVEFATDGLPSVAHAKRERRMVAQIFTSWNPLMSWLEQANRFRLAA